MSDSSNKSFWQQDYTEMYNQGGIIMKLDFVKNIYKKVDDNRKNITFVSTGLGLASAFLPWKTLGVFSINALQITYGWLAIVPFVSSAVIIGLNWPTYKPTKLWVGSLAIAMVFGLLSSYSEFDIQLPDENLNLQSHNATGIGYWLALASLVGLFISSWVVVHPSSKEPE